MKSLIFIFFVVNTIFMELEPLYFTKMIFLEQRSVCVLYHFYYIMCTLVCNRGKVVKFHVKGGSMFYSSHNFVKTYMHYSYHSFQPHHIFVRIQVYNTQCLQRIIRRMKHLVVRGEMITGSLTIMLAIGMSSQQWRINPLRAGGKEYFWGGHNMRAYSQSTMN